MALSIRKSVTPTETKKGEVGKTNEQTGFKDQDPVTTNKVPDTKTKPVTNTDKQEQAKTNTETKSGSEPEPKTEQVTDQIKVPEPPKTEQEQTEEPTDEKGRLKARLDKMSVTEVWNHFGGEHIRGNVSKVIRELNSLGYTTSTISKMTGKRYQHVRNVLHEDARREQLAKERAKEQANNQAKPEQD